LKLLKNLKKQDINMSKIANLGLNLVPSRLPKKNIVETDKAEEITSKIHAIVSDEAIGNEQEAISKRQETMGEEKVENVETLVESIPTEQPKVAKPKIAKTISTPSVKSAKKRTARTIIEDPDAVRKTSFDFPVTLYRSMKIRLAEDGISMRDYVIGLIEDDLNNR
jgi:hypothetical protein